MSASARSHLLQAAVSDDLAVDASGSVLRSSSAMDTDVPSSSTLASQRHSTSSLAAGGRAGGAAADRLMSTILEDSTLGAAARGAARGSGGSSSVPYSQEFASVDESASRQLPHGASAAEVSDGFASGAASGSTLRPHGAGASASIATESAQATGTGNSGAWGVGAVRVGAAAAGAVRRGSEPESPVSAGSGAGNSAVGALLKTPLTDIRATAKGASCRIAARFLASLCGKHRLQKRRLCAWMRAPWMRAQARLASPRRSCCP